MQLPKLDTSKVFGKPALSFVGLQIYYDRYEHQDHPIFKKDRTWFHAFPQQRLIRAALGSEFNHSDACLDQFGKRIEPSKLWVSVERRLGDQHHVVQPVYRGPCFWAIDKHGYLMPDGGNNEADKLLYRMHLSEGAYLPEMMTLAKKVADELFAVTEQNGAVN
ncbi:hypothetical protein [Tunturibacter empetritectus]|uniref:Uncharacterized protein n=1 Tax=Tunturiibacter lichenicola TaxID=2051959 RepID=A0A7W8J8A6_9BACT|nr:hypothetical protein [Edaphobacter lichenicola]MBB5343169.1 hypothetical protein [Edaphobacter lichenicola]